MGRPAIDLLGQTFGSRTVIAPSASARNGSRWKVRCVCGAIDIVFACDLRRGNATRCASCRMRETATRQHKAQRERILAIADAVTLGTSVNTLVVTDVPHGDGLWTLRCRFDRTQTTAPTADILSGAAVCPVCRPARAS
jgi:hypothetical protein